MVKRKVLTVLGPGVIDPIASSSKRPHIDILEVSDGFWKKKTLNDGKAQTL